MSQKFKRWLKILLNIKKDRENSLKELTDEFQVSKRTILKDVASMRDIGIPIVNYENKYSFPENYFMPPIHFNANDYLLLKLSSTLINSEDKNKLKDIYDKISILYPNRFNFDDEFICKTRFNTIDDNQLEKVVYAKKSLKKLKINYLECRKRGFTEFVVHPYDIFFYNSSWYLAGINEAKNELKYFFMKRISKVNVLEDSFEKEDYDIDKLIKDSWGLGLGNKYSIELKFKHAVAQCIKDIDWHQTQEIEELENGDILFKVEVSGLKDIKSWILGYGKNVNVVSPKELKDIIHEEIQEMYSNYNN